MYTFRCCNCNSEVKGWILQDGWVSYDGRFFCCEECLQFYLDWKHKSKYHGNSHKCPTCGQSARQLKRGDVVYLKCKVFNNVHPINHYVNLDVDGYRNVINVNRFKVLTKDDVINDNFTAL